MFKKAKTYRAIKGASIAVSAGLGAGREIVTLCVRGALLTTRPGFCHGVVDGAPMERDTGRNTVKSVQGQIRLAHWNRWSFIGCVIMSRILWNWMQHVHTRTCAYKHTHTHTLRVKVAQSFCAWYQKEPQLAHAWVTCNVRPQRMQFDATVTVTKNRRGGKVMLGLMRFGQKTLRRLLSDRKSRDCPAVYQQLPQKSTI